MIQIAPGQNPDQNHDPNHDQFNKSPPEFSSPIGVRGILAAGLIISLWALSLSTLLTIDLSGWSVFGLLPLMLWQTFLYTGLFITAHDAMHGAVCPQNRQLNDGIGAVALRLYALFSFRKLLKNHRLHHLHPARELDPDFHDGQHKHPWIWYLHFMGQYWSWPRLFALILLFHFFHVLIGIPEANLTAFWVLPPILSSLQLFYFGTYLPHREPQEGYQNPHRAQTSNHPVFWSFLTCYHFGYHQEHHQYPQIPWWQLPRVHFAQVNSPST